MASDEVEHLEHAKTSGRAAILGKGYGQTKKKAVREIVRSVANSPAKYDIGTPGRSSEMEDKVGIEDGPA